MSLDQCEKGFLKTNRLAELHTKPKIRPDILFKHSFFLEKYLYTPKYQRSFIAKMRGGTLYFTIETGMYANIPCLTLVTLIMFVTIIKV